MLNTKTWLNRRNPNWTELSGESVEGRVKQQCLNQIFNEMKKKKKKRQKRRQNKRQKRSKTRFLTENERSLFQYNFAFSKNVEKCAEPQNFAKFIALQLAVKREKTCINLWKTLSTFKLCTNRQPQVETWEHLRFRVTRPLLFGKFSHINFIFSIHYSHRTFTSFKQFIGIAFLKSQLCLVSF